MGLWFALPAAAGARLVVAVLFAGAGIGGLIMALRRRRILLPLLPFTVGLMVLLVRSGERGSAGRSRLLVPGGVPTPTGVSAASVGVGLLLVLGGLD